MHFKLLIYITVIFTSFEVTAQSIKDDIFIGNKWFSDNINDRFYKSDTIEIVRIQKFNSYNDSINERNIIFQYLGYKDITEVQFNKSGKMSILNLHVESWTNSWREGKWRWKFDEKSQILQLFFNKKLETTFKIISFKTDSTTWNMIKESKLTIFKIRLVRINNN
jgi:hypothetical protein